MWIAPHPEQSAHHLSLKSFSDVKSILKCELSHHIDLVNIVLYQQHAFSNRNNFIVIHDAVPILIINSRTHIIKYTHN